MTATIVNSAGLVFDIIGALLIWKNSLPPEISRDGTTNIVCEQIDESEKKEAKKMDSLSKIGALFLAAGFGLQLLSNFLR